MAAEPGFEVETTADADLGETLFVSLSGVGLAGVSALDYLVRQLDLEQIGHVSTHGLPDIAPFEDGRPRHPMRLYSDDDIDATVLVSELFVPTWAADPFAEALRTWLTESGIREVAVLHGVPFPHGPDEHDVFYVANSAYRDRRLEDTGIRPLRGGVFDGVVGELTVWSLAADAPPVGVFVTPTHPPGPDLDAALLFLDALQTVYDFELDEAELRRTAEDRKRHYQELADRLQAMQGSEGELMGRDAPDDRMYM